MLGYQLGARFTNVEIARTSHDTGKPPLTNYVIGNDKKKRKIFEKKQEPLENTGT